MSGTKRQERPSSPLTEQDLIEDIFDELMAQYEAERLQPGEVTASMLAEARGISPYRARELLARAERDGKMTCRDVYQSGHKVKAYRKADGPAR